MQHSVCLTGHTEEENQSNGMKEKAKTVIKEDFSEIKLTWKSVLKEHTAY